MPQQLADQDVLLNLVSFLELLLPSAGAGADDVCPLPGLGLGDGGLGLGPLSTTAVFGRVLLWYPLLVQVCTAFMCVH